MIALIKMFFTKDYPLRVGTDCSGIEAPIVALQQLKIPFSHEFSSEIDKHCIATIKANFSPKIIFGDMTKRKLSAIPDIDLYVCGFPCQPFSLAGKRLGERDPRGTIFWECLRVIRHKKPMVFILENVRGLLTIEKGETFKTMISELQRIKGYQIHWKVLNTADYGIPQSRKRVFIVGIQKKHMTKPFEWPEPIPCRPLEEFVDWGDSTNDAHQLFPCEKKMLSRVSHTSLFVDLSFRFHHYPNSHYMCPTILAREKLWCVPLMRYANIQECLQLQGFSMPIKSASLKKKHVGNTMSVNVVEYLLKSIFQTI